MEENLNTKDMHAGAKSIIFQRAQALRANLTEPEKLLWKYLGKKPLGFKFRRQHPFHIYILDFYCHKAKLSIEIDGKSHDSIDQKEHDSIRTKFIEGQGIQEIRFQNEEVVNNMKMVIEKIESALRVASLQGTQGRAEGKTKK